MKPLLVGSVKSNIGHTECVAGLCSIIKSIFALESGIIAPNINFTKSKPEIEPLESGILQVVTEAQKLEGSLIGINSFGIGGTNGKAVPFMMIFLKIFKFQLTCCSEVTIRKRLIMALQKIHYQGLFYGLAELKRQ